MTFGVPPPFPLLTSPFPTFSASLCPQCFSRIMGLSWGRKSAAPPVSSPARQDRCKVGGEREKERVKEKQVHSMCEHAGAIYIYMHRGRCGDEKR